ncbi:MarR family transcriptional regulator, partial [Acinetobacter baumannii]
GYYLGSNASYNVKKLVESGYIEQMISERDRRSTILRLTAKGRSLRSRIAGAQALLAEQIPGVDLANANETLRRIERL